MATNRNNLIPGIAALIKSFDALDYVVDEELATILYLTLNLPKPLLLEGHPGVGKTECASILAAHLNTKLIRLQCYEGLDVNSAVYEWNYQKQLLAIKIREQSPSSAEEKEAHIFSEEYLMPRPLLQAISASDGSPVLLIDEIDRADEEFEAFLLELLSVFQITIPEMGTVEATHQPFVVLTSNRTRELSDALKRRCLYHWVDYPSVEKEKRIVRKHLPDIEDRILDQIVRSVQHLRTLDLDKSPGVAETLDWASGLIALGANTLNGKSLGDTIGLLLKSKADIEEVRSGVLEKILQNPEA